MPPSHNTYSTAPPIKTKLLHTFVAPRLLSYSAPLLSQCISIHQAMLRHQCTGTLHLRSVLTACNIPFPTACHVASCRQSQPCLCSVCQLPAVPSITLPALLFNPHSPFPPATRVPCHPFGPTAFLFHSAPSLSLNNNSPLIMQRVSIAFVLLSSLVLQALAQSPDNYYAAQCTGEGPRCIPWTAGSSRVCFPYRWMSAQPRNCIQAACNYCYFGDRRYSAQICRRLAIYKNCFNGQAPTRPAPAPKRPAAPAPPAPPAPRPQPPRPQPRPAGGPGCAFRADGDKIVIPTWAMGAGNGWNRNGDGSITWKAGGGGGIDRMGSGQVCSNIKVKVDGQYYFTAVTRAPHGTEHNDGWFRFSGGFQLYKPGGRTINGNSGWYKGYQNRGGNRMADYLVTIDFNGHQFITNYLTTSGTYQVCISGRSTRFTVYSLVFVRCSGSSCSRFGPQMRNAMSSLPTSKCY